MLDVSNGVERVRAWPAPRGKGGTAQQKAQREWFRQASWAIKYMAPEMQRQVMEARQGLPLLPRDMLMMMLSGRLASVIGPTGRIIFPVAALKDVSESLDAINQLEGYILVRGKDFWQAMPFPTPGNVWWFQPPVMADFTLASADSENLAILSDPVKGVSVDCGTPVDGNVGRCAFQNIQYPDQVWQLDFHMKALITGNNFSGCGVVVRDSVSGQMITFNRRNDNALVVNNWYNIGWAAGTLLQFTMPYWSDSDFWRVSSDGGTLFWAVSPDGVNYAPIWSMPLSDWFPNKPDQLGFGGNYSRTTSLHLLLNIDQWTYIQ